MASSPALLLSFAVVSAATLSGTAGIPFVISGEVADKNRSKGAVASRGRNGVENKSL